MRMLAHFSKDETLNEIFKNGDDLYSSIASKFYEVPLEQITEEMRQVSKKISMAIINCQTPHHLVSSTSLEKAEIKKLMDNFFKKFNGVKELIEKTADEARETGFAQTILGRRKVYNWTG
jgi:DNA polymerase I